MTSDHEGKDHAVMLACHDSVQQAVNHGGVLILATQLSAGK